VGRWHRPEQLGARGRETETRALEVWMAANEHSRKDKVGAYRFIFFPYIFNICLVMLELAS